MSNPTNEQELRKRIVLKLSAKLAAHTPLGDTEILNAASITAHLLPLIQSYTNAEIAKAVKEAKPFPVGGSEFADGYMAGIKQYETKLMKFIERAKLKERDDE